MSNMPEAAKGGKTIMFRAIMKFHEKLLHRIGMDACETLRNTIWQLDEYLEENGKYVDTQFMKTLITSLEIIDHKKSGNKWTLAGAKKSLRGRTRGINQNTKGYKPKPRAQVPIDLSQSIEKRLIEIPRREVDDPTQS